MSRQELCSTGGNCQGDDRQESCSSAGNCKADEQTVITQLSRPWSRDWACTVHVDDHTPITWIIMHPFNTFLSVYTVLQSLVEYRNELRQKADVDRHGSISSYVYTIQFWTLPSSRIFSILQLLLGQVPYICFPISKLLPMSVTFEVFVFLNNFRLTKMNGGRTV